MKLLGIEDFARHINETFTAELAEGNVPFVLVEAAPTPIRPNMPVLRAPFSLMFRNSSAVLLPQQTYLMRHSVMGEVAIFLVPIARDREGFIYQAVFN